MALISRRRVDSDSADSANPSSGGGDNGVAATAVGNGGGRPGSSIANAGRWPVRVTDFVLNEPYEQPAVDYLELFFIRSGSFLHESEAGKQTLREGAVVISHPGNRQSLKHTDNCHLSRVRFLPVWLTDDFHCLIESPFTVSTIIGRQLFELPDKESIYVFSSRPERLRYLLSDVDLLRDLLNDGAAIDVLTRAVLVKILLQVGDEFGHFLRQRGGIDLPEECRRWLGRVEKSLQQGVVPEAEDEALRKGFEIDDFVAYFQKYTGLNPEDYLLRRRLDHVAKRLLVSDQRTGIIARALAFSDSAELTRKFEARYHVSPSVYRQKFAPVADDRNSWR